MYTGYNELLVEKQDKILLITFNNPKKKNSLNRAAYREIGAAVREAAKDESITLVVFTGTGNFFTAGNDISGSGMENITDMDAHVNEANADFRQMVQAVIDCPKVVVALVNGPAIGIGTTLAALADIVWCTENTYFTTPFTKLGLVPEAGSSYILPKIIGRSLANEMLLFGYKLNADEAYRVRFVSRIFNSTELESKAWPELRVFSETPPISLRESKRLIRMAESDGLERNFLAECEELKLRMVSEEFINAIVQFAMRKRSSKL